MKADRKILSPDSVRPRPIQENISVIIPTVGRSMLEESLAYIAEGTFWPGELIVVDQGQMSSVANWLEVLQAARMQVRYIGSSEQGRASALNRGLESVRTRFVAITDDDCFVESGWIEKITRRLLNHPKTVITGRVGSAGPDRVLVVAKSETSKVYHRPRLTFDALSGGNMATSTEVFRLVGLFDEDIRLRTAEDGEWSYRALRAGIPIIYAPEVMVWHYGWRGNEERADQYFSYARSHGGFYGKYLRKGDLFIAMRATVHHLRALRRWLRGLFTGDKELALFGRAYLTGLLPGIIAGMRRKDR